MRIRVFTIWEKNKFVPYRLVQHYLDISAKLNALCFTLKTNEVLPQVVWFRDTLRLDSTERRIMEVRGSRHTLIIRKVQSSDFGNYTCQADNQIGKAKQSLELSGEITITLPCVISSSSKRERVGGYSAKSSSSKAVVGGWWIQIHDSSIFTSEME